ncbi:mechanosensitive ion channel family protein [Virgibacillus salinus]|uniref:Small conductance mechanosensitive channel n=1 Tax=Virgibacillus salinus TaxID=553311 RepID=A0A1H1DWQ4_9BACI|nr:hypothetical protein [Virgibacillus salinus]SDQ80770.1 small conductance mechanosensitive channel [Virgibacillus salinus]
MEWMEVALPIIKNIALAIIVLIVGLIVIKAITNIIGKRIERSKTDDTLIFVYPLSHTSFQSITR